MSLINLKAYFSAIQLHHLLSLGARRSDIQGRLTHMADTAAEPLPRFAFRRFLDRRSV